MRGLSPFSTQEEIKRLKSEKLRLEELSHLVPPGDMLLGSGTGEIHKATSSSLLMAGEGCTMYVRTYTICTSTHQSLQTLTDAMLYVCAQVL